MIGSSSGSCPVVASSISSVKSSILLPLSYVRSILTQFRKHVAGRCSVICRGKLFMRMKTE
jgi:hypothetical protein